MKTGKLYVIGVGPGDPELLTVKGMRIIERSSCVCVPKGREEGSSLALSIVEKIVPIGDKEIIEAHFPMKKTKAHFGRRGGRGAPGTHSGISGQKHDVQQREEGAPDDSLSMKWEETVQAVLRKLRSGTDLSFITIGDPTIYSTFFYLYDRLIEEQPDLEIEIVPGVSSITAAASRAHISLGLADEKIAVLPATYAEGLPRIFDMFDTVVLMKVHRVFDRVRGLLQELGLAGKAVFVVRAGMDDERIYRDITQLTEDDMNYFSLLIVRK